MSEGSARVLSLLREYGALDRRHKGAGLGLPEYQRWVELRKMLGRRLSPRDRDEGPDRTPVRLRVEFGSAQTFARAWIRDLSRGGLFVSTGMPAELGTEIVLLLKVGEEEELELPAVVASQNVGDGFSTGELGMAVHFKQLSPGQSASIHALRVLAGDYDKPDTG